MGKLPFTVIHSAGIVCGTLIQMDWGRSMGRNHFLPMIRNSTAPESQHVLRSMIADPQPEQGIVRDRDFRTGRKFASILSDQETGQGKAECSVTEMNFIPWDREFNFPSIAIKYGIHFCILRGKDGVIVLGNADHNGGGFRSTLNCREQLIDPIRISKNRVVGKNNA